MRECELEARAELMPNVIILLSLMIGDIGVWSSNEEGDSVACGHRSKGSKDALWAAVLEVSVSVPAGAR